MAENERSRTFELKQRLLRRAWDGESNLAANGAEMMLLIQMRLAQCKATDEHKDVLSESRLVDCDQPRSVRMLNALARFNGDPERYLETTGKTVH